MIGRASPLPLGTRFWRIALRCIDSLGTSSFFEGCTRTEPAIFATFEQSSKPLGDSPCNLRTWHSRRCAIFARALISASAARPDHSQLMRPVPAQRGTSIWPGARAQASSPWAQWTTVGEGPTQPRNGYFGCQSQKLSGVWHRVSVCATSKRNDLSELCPT